MCGPTSAGAGSASACSPSWRRSRATRGLPLLRLETGIHNTEALALYRARGLYRVRGRSAITRPDPLSVFMEKRVNNLTIAAIAREANRMPGNLSFDDLKKAVAGRHDRHRARRHGRHAGPPDRQALPGGVFRRRRARGDARLRLPARQRHRHGAGARLRGGELGQGLRRFRHEARHGDAAPRCRGSKAPRWCSPTCSTTTTTTCRTRRAPC